MVKGLSADEATENRIEYSPFINTSLPLKRSDGQEHSPVPGACPGFAAR
jgi:hypothetical protein